MKHLLIFLSILIITSAQAQQNFEKLWTKVEVLEAEGKITSANDVVATIYKKAKNRKKNNQLIKALLYQSKYALVLQEDAELLIYQNLKQEISSSKTATKAILQSILADFKWQYLQQHSWEIYNRTKTTELINTDFRTWDLNTLFTSIHSDFKQSISERKALQDIAIKEFDYILIKGKETEFLRPTLYDLLAHRALAFFKTDDSRITKPKERFYIDDDIYFATSDRFSKLSIKTTDTVFSQFEVLKTYQKLEQFHSQNNRTDALIDAYINRLNFVNGNYTKESSEFYTNSLISTYSKLKKGDAYATVKATYAKAIYNNATLEKNPLHRKIALDICNEIIKNYPESEGFAIATNLKNTILNKTIQIQNEAIIPINQPSKVLVNFQNVEQLHFSIYKVGYNHNFNHHNYSKRDSVIKQFFKTAKPIKEFTTQLPLKKDYFNHSTEVVIPELESGYYIILATKDNTKNTDDLFAYNYQTVSNLVCLESNHHGKKVLQVLDRITGKPIENATVKLGSKTQYTNAIGEVSYFKKGRHQVVISFKNDELHLGNSYANYYHSEQQDDSKKARNQGFLFLDRSIYRPGQEVHFKGIVLTRENYKTSVLPNEKFNVSVKDANHQEIKSFELTTNEYGSFSEKFNIPKNVLTGNFNIYIQPVHKKHKNNFSGGHAYFSVEEYKRPKFEVAFKPIKDNYIVNQDINVKGHANALSGSKITDAKVTYRVVRKTQYSHWRYWNRYFENEAQEIEQGETITNDNGTFEINFKAIPDETTDKAGLPIINYEITADVTDVNGETRSSTTTVKVGYHSMTLGITTPYTWNGSEKNTISVSTANLNNEFTPSTITIQIYKLKAPNHILRTRQWQAPDSPLLSEKEFKTLFPNDAYSNEDNSSNWEKGALVFEDTINTEHTTTINTIPNLNWASGNYVIIAKGKDQFDIDIEQKQQFLLTNSYDTYLADYQLFNFDVLNSNTAKQDGFITVKLGTADNNLNVLTEAYFNSNQIYKKNILVNGCKTITIPLSFLNKKEVINPNSSVLLQFSLVRYNQHFSTTTTVCLTEPTEQLAIETKTFRDKLQPDSKETWSFTVKNKRGVQAEVLASMYDASLDQFKPHDWTHTINIRDYYRNTYSQKTSKSFNTKGFRVLNLQSKTQVNYHKQYAKLNTFGFVLRNNNIIKRRGNLGIENMSVENDMELEEVVVTALTGKVSGLQINKTNSSVNGTQKVVLRGQSSISGSNEALVIIDGARSTLGVLNNLPPEIIKAVNVMKGPQGSALYGAAGANGVIVVITNKKNIFENITARKNLNETAFFYPHLKTNSKGDVSFEFETPEALSRWKVQLFGHTKAGVSGKFTKNVMTQKELMVVPNPPRFLRDNDTIVFQSKVTNLTENNLKGFAKLELYNAVTGAAIDTELNNTNAVQEFNIDKKGNTVVSWNLTIPEGIQAVQYKVLAKANNFTDGEENVLPVVTNRMLVTESIPITVRANSSETYHFNKLKNNTSTTLKNHQLTLEYTSNPAWYAIQSLPYLMEFPHECAEQTFSRYYANSIGSHIMTSNPKIKTVFESWKANGGLTSKLEQNDELKQVLIAETPWLRDAQSDTEKKHRLGVLFDLEKLASEEKSIFKKLTQMQMPSGGFPWFSGGLENEYITRYIVAGFGHLHQLSVTKTSNEETAILKKAVTYLDAKFIEHHNRKLKHQKLEDIKVSNYELHYLYARSFFKNTIPLSKTAKPIANIYVNKAKQDWLERSLLQKTMLSIILHRYNDRQIPQLILEHLKETAIVDKNKGMYWKSNTSGWYWHEAPIETQALIIEAFSEITNDKKTIEELQIWLLNNKRKNDWNTTKATTEATYALLLQGADWLSIESSAKIKIGGKTIDTKKLGDTSLEAGTGYFKTAWSANEVTPQLADISVTNTSDITQFGGYYWQYFEQLNKITNEAHKNDIQLHKAIFLKTNTDDGPVLTKVDNTALHVGDLVTVRIELQVKDNFEFVHLKDMRASAFEPVDVISKYKWQDGTGYYQSAKDVATHFFFDRLNKGSYVLEYDVRVNNAGNFSNGISTIQSMYAPEFASHSKGVRVSVEK